MNKSFDKFKEAEIITDPYPHIIIKNFLDDDLARTLVKYMPRPDGFPESQSYISGKRYMIYFKDALKKIESPLETFTKENIHDDLYNLFFEKFSAYISSKRIRKHISQNDYSYMGESDARSKKVIMDGGFTSLAPDMRPEPSMGIHLDNPHKLGNILIYLKDEADTDPSGAFQMYRIKPTARINLGQKNKVTEEESDQFELVKEIPYTHNTLIAFPNNPIAFHGVEPRQNPRNLRHNIIIGFDSPRRVHNYGSYYRGVEKIRHYIQYLLH